MTSRILVTGAAGFLGSHLCRALAARGDKVVGVDNLSSGRRTNLPSSIEFVSRDIVAMRSPLPDHFDAICHLASPASPPDYLARPLDTLRVNSEGTLNVLNAAKVNGARFLLASTSEVYGDPLVHPQSESYWGNVNPVGPRAVYDEAKRYAEAATFSYRREHGVDTTVARIFNTYGPGMRRNDGRVVSNFICQALAGEDLTVYGSGLQTRSFCYVDDLVAGLVALLDSDCSGPVNLGNPNEFTVGSLAEMVLEVTQSKSTITYCPLPEDDPRQRCPDITLARETLGWEPRIALEEGVRRTAEWFSSAAVD